MINYNNVDLSFVYLARFEVSIINYIVKSVEADITMMKKSMTKCYTPRLNRNTQVRDIWRGLRERGRGTQGSKLGSGAHDLG